MSAHPLVALDIGSTKIACAIGLPHERAAGFELLGTGVITAPVTSEAWLSDPLLGGRLIEQALEATAVQADIDQALVAVSHPLLRSETVQVSVTLGDEPMTVRSNDLQRLQAAALDQVLGVDREPLVVERLGCSGNGFVRVRDPRGLTATRLVGSFHVVTMPMAARRAVVQAVESSGLEVARLMSTLPASFAGLGDAPLQHQRVLLLDLGGLSGQIGLFVEGVLQACRIIPSGGVSLALSLARDLHVTTEQAVTLSLEGSSSRRNEVRELIEAHYAQLQRAIEAILGGQPKPDAVVVTGRGALIDGFAEWAEGLIGVPVTWCRSPRTSAMKDLSRQVGLSAAIGLLELATSSAPAALLRSEHLFGRIIDRTRVLLTEYF